VKRVKNEVYYTTEIFDEKLPGSKLVYELTIHHKCENPREFSTARITFSEEITPEKPGIFYTDEAVVQVSFIGRVKH